MIVHLNGQLVERAAARIDPLDRGFVFGEGIYEGLRAIAWKDSARIVGLELHIERMRRGLAEAGIAWDASRLGELSEQLLRANGLRDAFVYWQVTGGAPSEGTTPRHRVRAREQQATVFGFCDAKPGLETMLEPRALRAITHEDVRWRLGAVKSISLMGNVWLARKANDRGAEEAILIRDGLVAEGLATNVILALPDGRGGTETATPSLESAPMLAGVTRALLLQWAQHVRERTVRAEELANATEVMLAGTTTLIASVVEIDGRRVGDGRPGPEARRLNSMLIEGYRAGRDVQ